MCGWFFSLARRFAKKQQEGIDAAKQQGEVKLQPQVPYEKDLRFLIDPFNNPAPFRRHYSSQLELVLYLPDMKSLLGDFYQKRSRMAAELTMEQEQLQSKRQFVVDSQFGPLPLPIEDILKKEIPKKLFRICNVVVGGVNHITLTDKSEEEHVQELISLSKNGDQTALSKQLRMFGYLYDYQIVKEAQNEILGLIETQVAINKFDVSDNEPSLNKSIESENFILHLGENEFGENIFMISVKEIEALKYKNLELTRALEIKSSLIEELEIDINTLENSIKKLEAEQTDENIHKIDFMRKEENWYSLLRDYNISITKLKDSGKKSRTTNSVFEDSIKLSQRKFLQLDIGFVLEFQYPASQENLKGFDERIKKLTQLKTEGGMKKLRGQIRELNAELFKLYKAFQQERGKLKILDKKYQELFDKQRKSTFGFGKSSVNISEQACRNFRTEMAKNQLIRVQEVFSQSAIFSDEQLNNAVESYLKLPSFRVPDLTPFPLKIGY
jgi:hypothetical protein